MAEVTRRVIIEVETRQKRSRLEAPDAAAAERTFKAESDAADRATASTERATESVKRHAETVRTSSVSIIKDFREAGEGAFRMARGLALLSASGSDDLRKLVQHVALAQGAFDVFAGGFKVFTNISRVLGGPVALAVTGVTAALGAGAIAWSKWKSDAEAATKAAEEGLAKADKRLADFYAEFERGRIRSASEAGRGISGALTPDAREQRIREEIDRQSAQAGIGLADISRFESSNIVTREDRRQAAFGARDTAWAAERTADLTRDIYDIQREQVQNQRRGLLDALNFAQQGAIFGGGGVFGGVALGTTQVAGAAFIGQFDQLAKRMTDTFQQMVDRWNEISAKSIRKAEQLEAGLQNAR
jgi:hypothetical protein